MQYPEKAMRQGDPRLRTLRKVLERTLLTRIVQYC